MGSRLSPALAIVVLTSNEELNLPACLASLDGLPCELVVVDSGSTDQTAAIAERHGATILRHPFETHTLQWRWALAHLPCAPDWLLGLDADQRLTPELRAELAEFVDSSPDQLSHLDGFYVNRRQIFRGRWIRHGGYYPKYLLKLFRPRRVEMDESDLIDHHFYVAGRVAKMRYDLIEDNQKERDLSFWIEKHNRYAPLHAREEMARRRQAGSWKLYPTLLGNPDQRTIWLKQRWYNLPLYVRAVGYFLFRYIIQRGFLDGSEGFVFHFLQACWYRVLVDVHLEELLRAEAASSGGEQTGSVPALSWLSDCGALSD